VVDFAAARCGHTVILTRAAGRSVPRRYSCCSASAEATGHLSLHARLFSDIQHSDPPGHAKSRLQGDFVVLAYVHSLPQEVWQKQYSRRQAVDRSIKKHGGHCRSQVVRTQRMQNSYVDFADVISVLLQPDLFRCVRQILQVNEALLLWGI